MGEEPQPSHSFEAVVTHVIDTDKFWVQPINKQEDAKKLNIIEGALATNFKKPSKVPKADDYVSVKLNERGWKRARLKQHIQHSLAYIQLIDYGNDEQVPESSLFTLPYELGIDVLQEQAVMCALAGVKSVPNRQQQAAPYLGSILMNRKVTVKAYSISPHTCDVLVDLMTPEFPSVRQQMLLHQICTPTIIPTAPHTTDPGPMQPKIGEKNGVIISHVNDLTDFYVQYRAAEKNISSMMTAMKSMYSANVQSPANMINIGMLCCVQLGSDWFRAEIKQVLSTGFILVMLKDFGNCQQVTAKQIYPLEGTLTTSPFWAMRCGLNMITPATPTPTGSFPKQLIQWFERYAGDSNAYYTAQFIRKADERFYIELYDESGSEAKPSTIDLLIQNNCAKRITTSNFPAYGGMQQQLNQMGSDMLGGIGQTTPQAYNNMISSAGAMLNGAATMNGHGGPGMTGHSAPGMTGHSAPGMTSHAGNMASHNPTMASQASGFTGYPNPMAQSPNFLAGAGGYMNTALQQQQQQFQQAGIAPGKDTRASIGQYPGSQQASNVTQFQQQQQPRQEPERDRQQPRVPRSRGESRVPTDVFEGQYKMPDLGRLEEVAVEIAEDPLNFTCILTKHFDAIDDINEMMGRAYNSGRDYSIPSAKVKPGMACVAPFDENELTQYYRAKVKSIRRSEAEIVFVDYGNTELVPLSDLKYLLKTCSDTPETYIQCAFENVAPTDGEQWGDGALHAFKDYFKDNLNFNCFIKGDSRTGGYKVELYPQDATEFSQPISKELEMRGVLQCLTDNRPSAAARGRRAHPGRTEPEMVRRPRSGSPQDRAPRARDVEDRASRIRDIDERSPREERTQRGRDVEKTQRGRSDDSRNRRRSPSPANDAVSSELQQANFKTPVIPMKSFTDVRVYQPSTPSKFSCQILSDKGELEKVYTRMQAYYDQSGDDDLLEDMHPFTACAALIDGVWNRGYILSNSYHGCQVVLVDTQEVVSVDQDQLRGLRKEFQKLPAQGVKCSLDGITCKGSKLWTSEASRYFKDQVADMDLVAEFKSEKKGVYKMLLHCNVGGMDQMVNAMFVVKGWAATNDSNIKQAVDDVSKAANNGFGMYKVTTGKSFTVVACYVNGPDDFYLHLVDERQNIEDLQEKVNDYYARNAVEKPKFNVDSYCAAMWEGDWYRARIVSVSREACELYFVDFGNVDVIPNTDIKGLAKQFKQQPMYAIRCALEGVDPNQMDQMQEIFTELVDADSEEALHATFIRQEKGSYLVSLYDGTVPLIQKMFKIFYSGGASSGGAHASAPRGGASRSAAPAGPPTVQIEDRELVQISHANNPTLLYLHSTRNGKALEDMSRQMNSLYNSSQPILRIKQVGELCAAQYSEDGEWYRSQIVALHGDQVQVRFMDYGNEETKRTGEVFNLDNSLREMKAMATPCSLSGIAEPPQGWADAQRELNICESMEFTAKIVDGSTSPIRVELYSAAQGASLAQELINNGYGIDSTRQSIPMPQTPSIEGGSFHATVSYADYPGRMYIQKVSDNASLEQLMADLTEHYKNGNNLARLEAEPKIGTVCCVKYNDDGYYYRATVYGITRSSIKIQFVDYGNCEDKNKSELFQLSDEYLTLPAQAIECSLQGCKVGSADWTPAKQEFLEGLVHEKAYNCQITGRQNDAYEVTLRDMATGNSMADDIGRFISGGGAPAQGTNSFGQPAASGFGAAQEAAPAPVAAKTDEAVKIEWPPRIDKFEHVPAFVAWGDGPEEFWINLVDRDDKLSQLQGKMQEVYANGGRAVPRVFRYMYLAVKSPEYGEIFRGKTLNNDRDRPLVNYVDFGNEEEVPRDNLYVLEAYLAAVLPCQAIRCALDGLERLKPEGEVRDELKKKFEEILAEKEIQVKNISPAQREKPHNEVEILIDGQSVIEILEKELVALSGPPDVPVCTATVGTVVKGGLVNIISPTDFWVQLAGPIARITDMTKVCTDSMKEVPELETYCAVVLGEDDDTVYRALVKKVEGDKITVSCIDYGFQSTLTLKSIYKLKQSCGDYSAQAFPCSLPLAVSEDKEEEVIEILKEMSKNCVTVKLYHKEEDRFTVDFSDNLNHLTLFVKTSLAVSTLPTLEEAAGVFSFQNCEAEQTYFVSHIKDLAEFYVQKSDLDIDELASTVATACSGLLPAVPCPTRGTPCVAKDSQYQAWNRVLVVDVCEGDMLKLLYLDYGSQETVKKTAVKELPASLHSLPVAAIKCSLSPLPEAYSQFTELFTTITNEREISITPSDDGGVSVTMDGSSLTDVFAAATHYSTLEYKKHELQETCNVYCTSVEDPYNVWVQIAEYEEKLVTLMAALTEYCPDAPTLYTTTPGTVCAALFPEDSSWYRAEIIKQGKEKCTVKFVDYGNCCEVVVASLKLLPEEHLHMPANSLLVRLAHVRPQTGTTWADAAIDQLFELTNEKLCEMKRTSVRAMQHVTLSVEGVDVATSMAEVAKLVTDPDVLTVPTLEFAGGETTVFVTHVEQVDQMYGQLEEHCDAMEALGAVTSDDLVTVDQPFLPLQCWAKWSDALYRADILELGPTQADVWFLDYGNKDKVPITDLWYYKPEHVELAGQAVPLKLGGVKPVTGAEWTAAAKDALSGLVLEQSAAVTLPALTDTSVTSEAVTVDMKVEEKLVAEQLKSSKVARSLVQPPIVSSYQPHEFVEDTGVYCTEVKIGEEGEVMVTCQLGEKLEEIQASLQTTITVGHPDYVPEDVTVEMPCTCKFTDDKQWYRAVVTAVDGQQVTVKFVDYGNSQTTKKSDIQLLPEQFNMPRQLFDIKLAGVQKMSDVDKKFLNKIIVVEEELKMKSAGEEASFFVVALGEDGEELSRSDVIEATMAHSAAVGSYSTFPLMTADSAAFTSHIVSPLEIYLQQAGCEEVLETITAQMAAHTDRTVIPAPFFGQPVLAVYESDLYRAVGVEMVNNKFLVRFVDYGNSALVSEVYEITPEEVVTPPQAIRCAIDKVLPKPGTPIEASKTALGLMLTDKEVTVIEADQTPRGVIDAVVVSVVVEELNVRLRLLQAGLIFDPDTNLGEYEKIAIPAKPVEVQVTHVENETLFFANRTGGEKVEKDEDDETVEEEEDDLVNAAVYVADMQTILEDTVPPVIEEVTVGTLCVTRWEEALYRAVVVWIQHDYAKVRFIDYGNTWYAPLSALLDCPEPYRGPGMAVPFTGQLNQTTPVSCDTEYLLEKSEGETVGMSVNVSLPAPKLLLYKYTKPQLNEEITAFVSVSLSHGQFYVQTEAGGEALEAELAPLIAAAVKQAAPVPHIGAGAPVLGLYQNDYYRGKVVEVTGPVAKVLFVDYGNTETCTKMVNVTPELMAVRVVGINCQLEGVNWVGVEAKPTFDEHLGVDAELTLTPVSYNKDKKQFAVRVVAGEGLDVNSTISESNVANKEFVETARVFSLNTFLPFYCSKFNSPVDLCCQVEEDVPVLETISAECVACPKINLLTAEPGTVCLAKDAKDNLYYRARVTSISDSIFTVHYVDYGNRETLALSALYDIPVALTQHKTCGIQCSVAGTQVPDGGCEADNLAQLQKLCNPDTELGVSVVSECGGVFSVHVMVGKECLRQHIQQECLAELSLVFNSPRFTAAQGLFISVANDPTDMYGQREQDADTLAVLAELVKLTDKEKVVEDPQPGTVCVALSTADEGLYRARVMSVADSTALVRYVDYGNTEEVPLTSLYAPTHLLLSFPLLAVPLALHAIERPAAWSEECLAALAEHVYEDAFVTVTPTTWSTDHHCEGDIKTETGASLKSLLIAHLTNTDPEWVATEPAKVEVAQSSLTYQKLSDGASTLYVSVANSPDDFYVQKEEWTGELETLQIKIDGSELVVVEAPAPGATCLAFSPELEGLYRAEILSVTEAGVGVRYVDYGNQETVPKEKIHVLSEELAAIPVYAVPCSVSSTLPLPVVGGVWKEAALAKFIELVPADSEVVVTPVSWSEDARPVCYCTLEVGGADVVAAVIAAGN